MITREEAIKAAGEVLAQAELALREGTVTDAALRSYGYVTGRYSLAEMEQRIAAIRAADRRPATKTSAPGRRGTESALTKSA